MYIGWDKILEGNFYWKIINMVAQWHMAANCQHKICQLQFLGETVSTNKTLKTGFSGLCAPNRFSQIL